MLKHSCFSEFYMSTFINYYFKKIIISLKIEFTRKRLFFFLSIRFFKIPIIELDFYSWKLITISPWATLKSTFKTGNNLRKFFWVCLYLSRLNKMRLRWKERIFETKPNFTFKWQKDKNRRYFKDSAERKEIHELLMKS